MEDRPDSTWHEREHVAIRVDDTEVGREVLLFERTPDGWNRRYAMQADSAQQLHELLGEVFPDNSN